jgi:hypothetical protein
MCTVSAGLTQASSRRTAVSLACRDDPPGGVSKHSATVLKIATSFAETKLPSNSTISNAKAFRTEDRA